MKNWKSAALVVAIVLGFSGASFAGTNPEWRPFKLGFGRGSQYAAPVPGSFPAVEITIFGGYASGFGLQTAESVATDLLTGMSSPWYGAGYPLFHWGGSNVPAALDDNIGGPMLTKEGGAQIGAMLGFNLTKTLQLELSFSYGFSGYAFDDTVYAEFAPVKTRSIAVLQSFGRTLTFTDGSVPKVGKTIMGGLNLNIGFPTSGQFMPYLTIGGGILSISDTPTVSWLMRQSVGASFGSYSMDITYASKISPFVDAGLGFKYYFGPNYGLKIEGRGYMTFFSMDKALVTGFQRSDGSWTAYAPYNSTILTEKGTPFFFTGIMGLFYGF